MRSSSSAGARDDATDSLAALLQPVCRLLLSAGLGSDVLQQAGKRACLAAAIELAFPNGARVNISRLSVMTGLTRKDVSALLRSGQPGASRDTSQGGEQRALRVLRGWVTDPRFQGPGGRPAELPLRGRAASFAGLVRRYGADVTPLSVLRELERTGAVRRSRSGRLRLVNRSGARHADSSARLAELSRLFTDFARSVTAARDGAGSPVFFGFRDHDKVSADEAARFHRSFAARATTLLDGFGQWVAGLPDRRREARGTARRRVGIGVYLLQEEPTARDLRMALRPGKLTRRP